MQLFYCNSQKNFTKKCFKSTFVGHFSAFQDFKNEILFQYSKVSYNNKVNFCELSDILRVIFLDIFLDVGGPSLFSKVHQAMNLTLLVRNTSCTVYEEKINCVMSIWLDGMLWFSHDITFWVKYFVKKSDDCMVCTYFRVRLY